MIKKKMSGFEEMRHNTKKSDLLLLLGWRPPADISYFTEEAIAAVLDTPTRSSASK